MAQCLEHTQIRGEHVLFVGSNLMCLLSYSMQTKSLGTDMHARLVQELHAFRAYSMSLTGCA